MDNNNATLGELTDLGGWSMASKFISGVNFILTKEGLFVRNPHGGETFRLIRIRDAAIELGLRDAPELVQHAFDYFTGSYSLLLDKLAKSGGYFTKKLSGSTFARLQGSDRTAAIGERVCASWMATGYFKGIASQVHQFMQSSEAVDRLSNGLLRDLGSPIDVEDAGSVLRKVRALKETLPGISEINGKLLEEVYGVEDKLVEMARGES